MKKKEESSRESKRNIAGQNNPGPTADQLVRGILQGDTTSLARAITLVESSLEKDREQAYAIIEHCLPLKRNTIRLGITGIPGVGKSTFIEALGKIVTQEGLKLAVLAIDPSSTLSKGSIMGDKTRMHELGRNPGAFIRPSPAGVNLGGVARSTRETMLLCEAAGFDLIIVETVGVGQSETAVHSMVDFFLLLQLAGAGDELQGIKRGIMEMADALVINKADTGNIKQAREAKAAYERALQLYPPKDNGWKPKVLTCSSIENLGVEDIWALIRTYINKYRENGHLSVKRREQNKYWFTQTVENQLSREFYSNYAVQKKLTVLLEKVGNNELSPFRAAAVLLDTYRQELK